MNSERTKAAASEKKKERAADRNRKRIFSYNMVKREFKIRNRISFTINTRKT